MLSEQTWSEIQDIVGRVKALGLKWQVLTADRNSPFNKFGGRTGSIACERGDCPMGALIRKIRDAHGVKWTDFGEGCSPYPAMCATDLGISLDAADVIASAADNTTKWYDYDHPGAPMAGEDFHRVRELLLTELALNA